VIHHNKNQNNNLEQIQVNVISSKNQKRVFLIEHKLPQKIEFCYPRIDFNLFLFYPTLTSKGRSRHLLSWLCRICADVWLRRSGVLEIGVIEY
jgi:hypothetical protein